MVLLFIVVPQDLRFKCFFVLPRSILKLHSDTEVLSLFANKYMVATIYFFKGLLSCDKMSNI